MINKQEINTIVNDYIDKVEADFYIKAHVVLHPMLKQASKAWHIGKNYNMPYFRFSNQFLHYGQLLPRACGKSVFIEELRRELKSSGFKEITSNIRGIFLLHYESKAVLLLSDPSVVHYGYLYDKLRGFKLDVPPLIIELSTPVMD